jgi:sterol desaturase/sphingolipid hydroxylase (fatty acid hydroxylase superfamily)
MMTESILSGIAGFVVALISASFVEWFVHLLMHRRIILGSVHYRHHAAESSDGFFWEFVYYAAGAIPAAIGFALAGVYFQLEWLGGGLACGSFVYAVFAAYSHQIQHERPELVFWMKAPVHTVHHNHEMYRANFGIGVDIWDRLFGTYVPVEWRPNPDRTIRSVGDFFRIRWF